MTALAAPTRLEEAFRRQRTEPLPGLMPYFTAGFPRLDDTAGLLLAAERSGCLGIELGIPFSDPLADGPTVQRTSWEALRNGMTLSLALEQLSTARGSGLNLPVAVMTYINPILAHGLERFTSDAAAAGADAVIVPDLPGEEATDLAVMARQAGLALVPLLAPTTPKGRMARLCQEATGFVYCVSLTGTTGARDTIPPSAFQLLDAVRSVTALPRALGFGLSRQEHLRALAGHADGAVVGSALLEAVAASPHDPVGAAQRFLLQMSGASPPGTG